MKGKKFIHATTNDLVYPLNYFKKFGKKSWRRKKKLFFKFLGEKKILKIKRRMKEGKY